MDQSWTDLGLAVGMFLMMFGMGLTLVRDDFRRVARSPRATIVGTTLQLFVMPVAGIALANAFELSPILSAGIVVVAACPGGMFSNVFVHVARGHTALSITLTASATLATLFTLPLWVRFALTTFSTDGAPPIEMPVLDTAARLGTLTVLPVLVGMGVRQALPWTLSWERKLTAVAFVLIGVSVGLEGSSRPEVPFDDFLRSLGPAAAFALTAMVVGVTVPAIFGLAARDVVTIAVELIVKNTLLGIALVGQVLDFEAVLPIFAFAIFQTPGGILLLTGWKALERRGAFAASR